MSSSDSDSLILNVELLSLSSIDKHIAGHLRTKWSKKNLSSFSCASYQMIALLEVYVPSTPHDPWLLSLSKVALAFEVTKVCASW
jgi:hypothetical protein